MSFVKYGKLSLGLSVIAMVLSIALMVVPGPKMSIEFTGGTLMEIVTPADKTKEDVTAALNSFTPTEPLGNVAVITTKDGAVLLRMRSLSNEEHLALIDHFESTIGAVKENQFTTIGPTVGNNLKQRSFWALVVASIAIVIYVAIAFRNVPRRMSPWRFGVITILATIHDIIVTTGIFVVLSHYTTFEIDTLFITALLTIIGYSTNDTIIIFDRIRENLGLQDGREDFAVLADRSLRESLTRTFNTSGSTLIMLFALYFLGPESIKWFVLTLILGTLIGTYSSIFLATPILVYWRKKA